MVQVHVKLAPEGKRYSVEVENLGMTVEEFKRTIEVSGALSMVLRSPPFRQTQVQVPADQQRLIFKGHVLRDQKTLQEYGALSAHALLKLDLARQTLEKT